MRVRHLLQVHVFLVGFEDQGVHTAIKVVLLLYRCLLLRLLDLQHWVLLAQGILVPLGFQFLILGLVKGYQESECCTFKPHRVTVDIATKLLHNHLTNMKSEANAFRVNFLCGLQKSKKLEQLVLVLLLDANPLVLD